ncbi:MAG: glycoside hydrolase family 2 protein, partial [Chloroflexota bacterium]
DRQGQIVVPFAVESALSGVEQPLLPDQRLWYRRTLNPLELLGLAALDGRVLLHFEAVDWQMQAYINGSLAGEHTGGYLPFTFDITGLLRPGGDNELVVAVYDPTDSGRQEYGKQTLRPHGIWYTAVSGIWQTVWLEAVPHTSIAGLRLLPDLDQETLTVETALRGPVAGVLVEAVVFEDGLQVAAAWGEAGRPLELRLPGAHPWSPDDPFLYDLRLRLVRDEQVIDEVGSYFAMRKFSTGPDAQGRMRFLLNNRPLFLYGPLDQGYFPDGLYTPPSEAAMLSDIEYARKIGCNMIRKHIKVEPRRWYAACDRLGMIVWQDMPSGGVPVDDATADAA